MRQGARFSAVAQQFSQSATAAVGGDMGWLRPEQLSPDLAKAAASLKSGELSPPIRTNGGYYLLLVVDRRNGATGGRTGRMASSTCRSSMPPLPPNANEAQKRAAAAEVVSLRGNAKNCADFLRIGKEKAPQFSSQGQVTANNVTPQMRQLLDKLTPNEVSQPILQRNGIGAVMLCSKQTQAAAKSTEPNREEIFESLLRQKLDTVARRYLRDLRRVAYVDVRV